MVQCGRVSRVPIPYARVREATTLGALLERAVVSVLATVLLSGCGLFAEKPDPTANWSAQRLYSAAKLSLNEGDYELAIDYYSKLESRYPFGPLAQQGLLELAYVYYKYQEPESAIATADRFIRLYPTHPGVDYAYYLKGLTNFNRGRGFWDRFVRKKASYRDPGSSTQAFRDFAELTRRFPDSRYAEDARRRMVYLKNTLAEYEINVANYYMRRGAYLAAVNRAQHVVENYPGTPAVPDALVIMAKGYKVMGLEELSSDSLRVLKLNYPENPGITEVEQLVLK